MNEYVLYGWNRCYGCMRFKINIPYGCTIEEVKKHYEQKGYYCWIEKRSEENDKKINYN